MSTTAVNIYDDLDNDQIADLFATGYKGVVDETVYQAMRADLAHLLFYIRKDRA